MAHVELADIEAGMILANDLKDPNGRFLLSRGETLSTKHIRIMKTWGVVEADIEGVTENDLHSRKTAKLDPDLIRAAETELRTRFQHNVLEQETTRRLFDICVLRRTDEISKNGLSARKDDRIKTLRSLNECRPKETLRPKCDPKTLVRNKIKLPSLPTIFNRINEAIDDPRCSATHIAGIISKDSSLTARLLKLVNSAFYGFPSKIDTISRAVAIIGTRQLSMLSLGTCALTAFKDVPNELIDMKSFWKHSVACGLLSKIISSYRPNAPTERFFVAGLLHDIGRLVIFQSLPEPARESLIHAAQTNTLLHRTEKKQIGFDHALVGGMLLNEWNFPAALKNAVRFHHRYQNSQEQLDTAIVHVADIMVNALEIGSSGERLIPEIDPNAWEKTGLSARMLGEIIIQAEHHIDETMQVFIRDE